MSKQQEAEVLQLPELPPSQQGTSTASTGSYTASVSNAAGYLCHIQLNCRLEVTPEVVFEIFSHPDNAGAFRDIKKVGYRKVVESAPGFKRVEVEQVGELRVMWMHRTFRTYLDVTEDARDPECLKTDFTLLRSDILARFHGAWELRPIRDTSSQVVGCDAVLTQDVLPRGVPSFFARLPVLGGLLRQVSLGTIKRLVEDLLHIVKKYKAGAGKLSVGDVLIQIAGERGHKTITEENRAERLSESEGEEAAAAAAGGGGRKHGSRDKGGAGSGSNGSSSGKESNVTSFAVDDFSDSEELSSEGAASVGGRDSGSGSDSRSNGGVECAGSSSSKAAAPATQQQQDGAVAAAAAAAAAAVAAAGEGEQHGPERSSGSGSKQRHRKGHRAVGVMLDVSQHGHVSVVLVPREV